MNKLSQPARRAARIRAQEAAASRGDNLYARALSEAETEFLKRAQDMEGLDHEIAILRTKIHSALQDHPDDMALLMKGIGALTRTLGARHRLADKAEKDLFDNLVGTLRGLGEQLFPDANEGDEGQET